MTPPTNHLDHPFLELIKKADHFVVEKEDKEEYMYPYTMSFNGFLSIEEFIDKISFEFENYIYLLELEINKIQFKADRIKFINNIINHLEKIIEFSFKIKDDKIIKHLEYKFKDDFSQNFITESKILNYNNFLESQFEYIKNCINRVKQEKQDLENLTQEDIDKTYGTSSSDLSKCLGIKKIKTSLTVRELAFFFKILKDANIFEPNNATDFGKVVSEIFSSKKKDSFSQITFMKEYHKSTEDLYDAAVKFSTILLPELKKISEDYRNLKK
jgi:hypothetical protein